MFLKLTKCTDELLVRLSKEGKLYHRFEYRKTKRSKPIMREHQLLGVTIGDCGCKITDIGMFSFGCEHTRIEIVRNILGKGKLYVNVD